LIRRGHNPDTAVLWFASNDMARLVNRIENDDRRPFPRAMAHLYTLAVPEIRKSNRGDKGRGCVWHGLRADPAEAPQEVNAGWV
jgi:hypothetical protein